MDPGRYGFQQGWDNNNNSALEGYGAVHEPNFRVGGSYDERRFLDERYPQENVYPRNSFHHDIIDRDNYPPPPPPPSVGVWPRRRSYEEEFPLDRDSRRYERQFVDPHPERNGLHDPELHKPQEFDKFRDGYRNDESYRRDRDNYAHDDYDHRSRISHSSREDSRERDRDYGRDSYDSDYDGGSRRDGDWRRRGSRDRERDQSPYRRHDRERDESPYRRHERSRSRGSRSPRGRSYSRSYREDSFDDGRYERNEKRRDREEKRQREYYSVAPSPTVVVKGLSLNTTEEDLYQILAEWGPLRHVRVIKERNSGTSRGFAFIDFPSLGAARAMMDKLRDDGLSVDGRRLFFEYSSKPTAGSGGSFGPEGSAKSGHGNYKSMTLPSDWVCTSCGYINFARRTSCFQCNEARSEDAPPSDISNSNPTSLGKKGTEAGPSHVLVVRGLDDNADEEMIRYEFSKHVPIKDLRLVRDKFTHVSRGFAFVHFHSVEDASKALEATNGTTLEKHGQVLRVAFAKSILGPGNGQPSSSLAAAAIEAATFAQQYDAVGWAPKEYNPDDNTSGGNGQTGGEVKGQNESLAPQSGFVWDEASGYYYDSASGFYYDGNTGLYYDGNSGVWYSFDQQKQQYIPCTDQNDKKPSQPSNVSDGSSNDRKVVISAPATTTSTSSLADAVQAAATAAIAAEKKEKEKSKEIKLASKISILANKKKMNNVLTMWKQRSHEGQAIRVALDNQSTVSATSDKPFLGGQSIKSKPKTEVLITRESSTIVSGAQSVGLESPVKPRPVSNSLGGSFMGVIRGSGRGVVKSDTSFPVSNIGASSTTSVSDETAVRSASLSNSEIPHIVTTPFKTDTSALGGYTPPVSAGSGKRRFSEMPLASAPSTRREQPQSGYRDRAAERRSLYGSSSSKEDGISDIGFGDDSNRDLGSRKGSLDAMPFPPGVGGGRPVGDAAVSSFEVITADKAIDETNVGNRMLRSMGWQEGLGLGRDGSGMTEPVQAQASDNRAGLGSRQKKPRDPTLEVQAGDSYKTLIHKKALARFREMS